jgi:rhodanese-related sulfurtransferase
MKGRQHEEHFSGRPGRLGPDVSIIDVREQEEYSGACVPGRYRNGHPVTYQAGGQ